MFQPTNESYVRAVVEETMARYDHPTDDDQIPTGSQSYRPGQTACQALHALGHLFLGLGERLERLGTTETALPQSRSTLRVR